MYRVVMVDDEPWALEGLAEVIDWEKAGFTVERRFTDPQEAFGYLCAREPDVVFTDIRMPGLSGVDMIAQARDKGLGCEFVLISSYEDFEAAQKAIPLSVCQYILKPYDMEELEELAAVLRERLAKKQHAPVFQWDGSPEETQARAQPLWETAGRYSAGFLCLGTGEALPPGLTGPEWVRLSVRGTDQALLALSNDARTQRRDFLDRQNGAWGVSRVHENAKEELAVLLREAWYSLRCGFQYAEKDVVGDIQYYLCRNMQAELSLGAVAEQFHFSEPYFCALFKRGAGMSVMRFTQHIRIAYAAYLIGHSEKKLQEVSEVVGFSNYSYFGKLFKKFRGVTPESFRAQVSSRATGGTWGS